MTGELFNELEFVTHHSISDFLLDEEASIPKGQLLAIGSLMVVLSCVLGIHDASAWHTSHQNWGYPNHSSHSSHSSHASHASHASHSNNMLRW